MSAKEFAAQLRRIIVDLKANGTAAIYSDNLIEYLNNVIASPSPATSEAELEQYRSQLQLHVAQYEAENESSLEMFRSVIQSGQNAMRSSFLLNGGAAIAMLAFISRLTEAHLDKVAAFTASLIPFVIGVLAIAVTSGATYLSQWFYSGTTKQQKIGFSLNIFAIVLGLSSYGFFSWGMITAYHEFLSF